MPTNFRLRALQILAKAFLRLIRFPNLLIIVATQYMVRIFLIGPQYEWRSHLLSQNGFLLSLSTLLVAAAGYIINDYYDIKIDIINKPKRVVIGRMISRRKALVAHALLSIVGIGIGFFLSKQAGLINLVAVFLLWLYSNQLKRLPFVGNLSVAVLTALSLWIMVVYYPQNKLYVFTFAAFAFFITLIREIIKDIEDVRGDVQFGCLTLPILWGIRRTKTVLYLLILLLVLVLFTFSSYLQLDYLMISYFAIAIGLPVGWLIWRLFWADTRKDFVYLSFLCKIIILIGVLSMLFI